MVSTSFGVAIAAGVVVIVMLFLAIAAQGAPASPTAAISGTLNPAQSQVVQVTFETQFYSLVAPNTIYQIGATFIYSVWQTSASGGYTSLAQNLTVPFHASSYLNGIYTAFGTITITTVAICSAQQCAGVPFNLTINVKAAVSTYEIWAGTGGFFASPIVHIVFSNIASYQSVPSIGSIPTNQYYAALIFPLAIAAATVFFAVVGAGKVHWLPITAGLISVAIALLSLVFLVWI